MFIETLVISEISLKLSNDVITLKNELDVAIRNEKFELAAIIRDKINSCLTSNFHK